MRMLWPAFLYLLGLIPLLVAIYVWILRRRRRFAVRYSSLSLVRQALSSTSHLRRHLPFALFLMALASLVMALTRPAAVVQVPTGRTTVILAMDVSRSMCATDIPPSRLEAAKAAAISFIQQQDPGTQIGIVAFAGFAEVIQTPTSDQELLLDAINSLNTARRTAIGSAILESLNAIAEIDPDVPPVTTDPSSAQPGAGPEGSYAPHIVILLTDGANNAGPLPVEAAQQAAARGVRVYTIGFGTARGGDGPLCDQRGGDQFGFEPQFGFDPQFGGGGGFRRGIDEETLKQIAELTDARYYAASSAGELQSVFEELPISIIMRQEQMEVSVAFVAISLVLVVIAMLLALLWHPLV